MYTAYKNGIKNPYLVMRTCDEVGLPFAAACAMLMKESAGGSNIFGHDRNSDGSPRPFYGAGKVTKKKYLAYKKERLAGKGAQGVGPCQLTWYEFQDEADRLGGCWKPKHNMQVGFRLLRDYRAGGKNSWEYVGTRYNGGADYGRDYAAKVKHWKNLLS